MPSPISVLTQHDEIREELIKQDAIPLLLRCALEPQFKPMKAKLPSLEILLALAFNKDISLSLKSNSSFMNEITTLVSSSESSLRRAATGLIWMFEKEEQTTKTVDQDTTRQEENKYDIMISYSHRDKDLCFRIRDLLINNQFQVWIDVQSMHGSTFDAMSEAIENSEIVLICMSDAYKQSVFCQMEAGYAVTRRRHLIPLMMTQNYKADGWLGLLTSRLIYIDFPKLGFNRAFQELKKQIDLYRRTNSNTKKPDSIIHQSPMTNSVVHIEKKPIISMSVFRIFHLTNSSLSML
jgi:TIR domain